jgi:hypothetical protein
MAFPQRTFQSGTPEQRKRRLNDECQTAHYRKKQKSKYRANIDPIDGQDSIGI